MTKPNATALAKALAQCKPGQLAIGFDGSLSPCQLWPGSLTDSGYPRMEVDGKTQRLPRVALATRLERDLGDHEKARHTCDCRLCINPEHLTPGTQADNVRDMMQRGRHVPGKRKITPERADAARKLRGPRHRPHVPVTVVADFLGVNKRQAERLLSGRAHAR